jgi:hypothetical protein
VDFIVTNLARAAERVVAPSTTIGARRTMDQRMLRIKGKRLSRLAFGANFVRLQLHVLAC